MIELLFLLVNGSAKLSSNALGIGYSKSQYNLDPTPSEANVFTIRADNPSPLLSTTKRLFSIRSTTSLLPSTFIPIILYAPRKFCVLPPDHYTSHISIKLGYISGMLFGSTKNPTPFPPGMDENVLTFPCSLSQLPLFLDN